VADRSHRPSLYGAILVSALIGSRSAWAAAPWRIKARRVRGAALLPLSSSQCRQSCRRQPFVVSCSRRAVTSTAGLYALAEWEHRGRPPPRSCWCRGWAARPPCRRCARPRQSAVVTGGAAPARPGPPAAVRDLPFHRPPLAGQHTRGDRVDLQPGASRALWTPRGAARRGGLSPRPSERVSGWAGSYHDDRPRPCSSGTSSAHLGMGGGGSSFSTRAVAPVEVDAVGSTTRWWRRRPVSSGLTPDPQRLRVMACVLALPRATSTGRGLYQGASCLSIWRRWVLRTRARMAAGGMLLVNVFDRGPTRVAHVHGRDLRRVFPPSPCSPRSVPLPGLRSRRRAGVRVARRYRGPAAVGNSLSEPRTLAELVPSPGTPIFTDDHAPVEDLIRRMMEPHWARLVGSPAGKP
jgi:hypothetical protein